jgi:Ca2+-binding RTX toxin-like protein
MSGRFFFKNGFTVGAVAQAATVVSVTPTHVRWITTSGLTLDGVGIGLGVGASGLAGAFTAIVARDAQGDVLFEISGISLLFSDAADGFTIAQLVGGDDVLEASAAADAFDGGAGFDVVSYAHAAGTVIVNLAQNTSSGAAAGDTFRSIEGVFGSRFGDNITGDANGNRIFGDNGNDALFGQDGDDFVSGGAGSDAVIGGNGDDTLEGGGDADILSGGDGFDYASYLHSDLRVIVNLGDNRNGGGAAGDRLDGVEGLLG